jgi:hypothetical protein
MQDIQLWWRTIVCQAWPPLSSSLMKVWDLFLSGPHGCPETSVHTNTKVAPLIVVRDNIDYARVLHNSIPRYHDCVGSWCCFDNESCLKQFNKHQNLADVTQLKLK